MKLLLIILSILSSFFTKLETETLQSDFEVVVNEGQQGISQYSGNVTMKGSSYLLSMGENKAAFDGKTMCIYYRETDELTLTEPTEDELREGNMFLFAKALVPDCETIEKNEGEENVVTLVPNDKSIGVDRFILHIRTEDLAPLLLEVEEHGNISTLKLNNPKYVSQQPTFTIEPEETTFVNDLRF